MGLLDKLRKNVRKVADDIASDPGETEAAVAAPAAAAGAPGADSEAREPEEFAEPDAAPPGRDSM